YLNATTSAVLEAAAGFESTILACAGALVFFNCVKNVAHFVVVSCNAERSASARTVLIFSYGILNVLFAGRCDGCLVSRRGGAVRVLFLNGPIYPSIDGSHLYQRLPRLQRELFARS